MTKKNYYDCLWEKYLSQNITFPENFWDLGWLSENPNITWEIVQANPDKHWSFFSLSQNPNITCDIVQANIDKPWYFEWLSENPNITWEIVQANPDKDWHFYALSENPNITWEIVKANPDKPWNYEKIFLNHIGKQKFIEELKRAVNVISDWFIELKTNPDSNLCKKWMKTVQSEFYNKNPWE